MGIVSSYVKKAEDTQRLIEVQMPKFLKKQHFVKAMRGDNGVGIERYVLGVLLQTILQYANQLLRQVHDGRYQLYRSDEAIGRVRKSGLELGIYDSYSMGQRSVVSLSGGEKFLVSLALSLATSFVVQSKMGVCSWMRCLLMKDLVHWMNIVLRMLCISCRQ